MRREKALNILAAHAEELRRAFGIASLSLFGSVARDEAGPGSDVDVLVEFDREAGPVGLFHLFDLRERLQHLLGCRVDLVERDAVKRQLRERIYGEEIRAA